MKITYTVLRVLLGLLFLFASITWLFKLFPQPEVTGALKVFNDGVAASGYLMYLVKITELACGLALVSGFYVPLAAVVIAPISINILMVHIFLDPAGLPVAIFVVLVNLFLGYYHREKYLPLLVAK